MEKWQNDRKEKAMEGINIPNKMLVLIKLTLDDEQRKGVGKENGIKGKPQALE